MLLAWTNLYTYSYMSQVYLGAELTRNDSQWQNYPAGPFQNNTITIKLDNVPEYSSVSFGFSGGCSGTMGSFSVLVNGASVSGTQSGLWVYNGSGDARGTGLSISLVATGWDSGSWVLASAGIAVDLPTPDIVTPPPMCPISGMSPPRTGAGGVDYATGALSYSSTDLLSQGLSGGLAQTRDYANVMEQTGRSESGVGFDNSSRPFLRNENGSIRVVQDASKSLYFDPSGSSFVPRFYVTDQLTYTGGTDTYTLTSPDGSVSQYWGFGGGGYGSPNARKGQIKLQTDADGNTASYTYNSTTGLLESISRTSGTTTETLTYARVGGTGMNRNQVASVTQARNGTTIGKVEYSYYNDGDSNGNSMDLKMATISEGGEGTSTVVGRKYYRYWTADSGTGYMHGLKYVFDTDSYTRLSAAYAYPDAQSDATVAPFADHYYEYDSQHRVTRHIAQNSGCSCAGGTGTYTYTYSTSGNSAGANSWNRKTIETLPDGSTNTVYLNSFGEVMLSLHSDGTNAWRQFYEYDNSGRMILHAKPSAITGYSESYADLLHSVSGNYEYLSDSAGLIETTAYAASTTATTSVAGNVAGYKQSQNIQEGETGTPVAREAWTYIAVTGSQGSIYPMASDTAYADTGGGGGRTTSYSYTYASGTTQLQSKTTTYPTVSTAHNGSGSATSTVEVYDTLNRLIWTKDETGYLTYRAYDLGTGALTTYVLDADSSRISNPPAAAPTRGADLPTALHLVTSYEVDSQGRTTKETDPSGRITYTVYKNGGLEKRVYRGWTGTTCTGPIEITIHHLPTGTSGDSAVYDEYLTSSATPSTSGGIPTGQETIDASNITSLSRAWTNEGGQVTERQTYFSLSGITFAEGTNLGSEGTNYLATDSGYEKRGRLAWVEDPTGTITHTFYDSMGNVIATWIGQDDLPTSDQNADGVIDWRDFRKWVSSNPTATTGPDGTNMVKVADYQYDNNTAGDGDRTQATQYPDSSTSNTITMVYDWRDRLTDSKAADGLVTKYTYDNLGETTMVNTYVDSDNDWTIDTGELRSQSESAYDERGQVYLTIQWEVKPSNNHNLKSHLATNYWYDPRGLVMKTQNAAGLFTKTRYDGVGRLVSSRTGYDVDETSYADAGTNAGDTMIERNWTAYDEDGNAVVQVNYKRFENDTTTLGCLNATNSYASSVVTWYDAGNRITASANIGHESASDTNHYVFNSSSALIDTDADGIPDIAEGTALSPNSSDDYIVTKLDYDAAGNAYRQTDNAGHITQTNRDMAGRVTKTIANYVDGNVIETEASDTDQTTQFVYDSAGRLYIQRALNPKGSGNGVEQQDTRYLYEDAVNAALLTNTIYPDSSDTDSSGTDQVKFTYDRLGRKLTSTDQRGVVHTYGYDPVGRLVSDAVTTLPTGVDGSVRRIEYVYQDDGKLSTVTTYDAASSGNIVNQIKYTYDGWGDTKTEQSHSGEVTTGTPAVTYTYEDGADANGNASFLRLEKVTYPGGRQIHYIYESTPTGRLSSISENAGGTQNLVVYSYSGMGTIVSESHPQVIGGLNLSYGSGGTYVGWDRFGRIPQHLWKNDAGTTIDGYTYSYDRAGNRTSKTNTLNSAYGETYSYDGLNRLVDANRNGSNLQDWTLDALGNWSGFTDGANSQTRTADAANEITGISGSWVTPTYDAAGNMISSPKAGDETTRLHFVHDAWNHLVQVQADNNGQPGTTIAIYAYDGLGRRVSKTVGTDTYDFYYNENYQIVEVRKNGASNAYEQYVYGVRYIDAPVMVYRDTDTDGANIQKLFIAQDANFNVTAIVDAATGNVADRFVYTPYGLRTVLTATWTAGTTDFMLGHQGLWLDAETSMYYNRARFYHPTLGTFIQRDPLGYVDGGTLYRYERGSPTARVDPSGEFCRIALRCSGVILPIGPSHCGIVVDDDSGATSIDGSGGRTNEMVVRPVDSLSGLDFRTFPDSACACLRDNITNWNRHRYPRWDLSTNSAWALKCYLGGCGLTAVFTAGFPPGAKPIGWNNKYCNKWTGKAYCSRCVDWTECPRDYEPVR